MALLYKSKKTPHFYSYSNLGLFSGRKLIDVRNSKINYFWTTITFKMHTYNSTMGDDTPPGKWLFISFHFPDNFLDVTDNIHGGRGHTILFYCFGLENLSIPAKFMFPFFEYNDLSSQRFMSNNLPGYFRIVRQKISSKYLLFMTAIFIFSLNSFESCVRLIWEIRGPTNCC